MKSKCQWKWMEDLNTSYYSQNLMLVLLGKKPSRCDVRVFIEAFSTLPCWSEGSWHESMLEGHAARGTRRNEWHRLGNTPMSASLSHTAGNESEGEKENDRFEITVYWEKHMFKNITLSSPAPSSWRSRHSQRCCWAMQRRSVPTPGIWKLWNLQEPKPDLPYWRT